MLSGLSVYQVSATFGPWFPGALGSSYTRVPMSRPLNAHRLLIGLVVAMAVVALIGWTAYARSESSSAMRDRERVAAMARMASERDGLLSNQERLQRELELANAQLAVAQERMLEPQITAEKGVLGQSDITSTLGKAPPKRSARTRSGTASN
jgi:hypothetical protein